MYGSNIFLQDGSRKNIREKEKNYTLPYWIWKRIYGVGGKLHSAIKSFYKAASACVKINGETSEH